MKRDNQNIQLNSLRELRQFSAPFVVSLFLPLAVLFLAILPLATKAQHKKNGDNKTVASAGKVMSYQDSAMVKQLFFSALREKADFMGEPSEFLRVIDDFRITCR